MKADPRKDGRAVETAKRPSPGCSLTQSNQPSLPAGLCCPRCKGLLAPEGSRARCVGCGQIIVVHGGRMPDLLDGGTAAAEAVLGWPCDFVGHAMPWLLALASHRPVSTEVLADLKARQLIDSVTRLTALGNKLAYHCQEFSRQSTADCHNNFWRRFLHLSELGTEAAVLDIGCGAGQTLRLLQAQGPAERIGLDIDLEALAFGCRLTECNQEEIRFVRGSAHQIPFRDDRFTHVICRVALNYLHQRRALGEMGRVLQSGGYLYCSVEGCGYDLDVLKRARTAAQLVCRLRDLSYGCLLALTGVQPTPGRRLTGGRSFGTLRRCTRVLARLGCVVIHAEITARYLGFPLAFGVVARKR